MFPVQYQLMGQYQPMGQYPSMGQYPQYLQPKSNSRGMAYLIILFILVIGGLIGYYIYALIKNITGIYEWSDPSADSLIDIPMMTVRLEKMKLKIIGVLPDESGFLTYGFFPFFNKVNMYPIKSQIPSHTIRYKPFKKNDEYYMTISKFGDSKQYIYKKTEDLPVEE